MTCPICGKKTETAFRPFCGRACANRDLLHWLNGRYAVPGPEKHAPEADPDEEEETNGKWH
ncbi:DNA gyrase inhibitor YacG [Roseovarius aestuariivivens]|uniref:DNA gyrase inhibitor YacG n=1 Tax=Roseovarius aestuariivivens TaxID=1888910 RepID=UPI0010822E1C|nr:DNA gyrase inhibitor YacG [Roseovarius aestuariivivens]